MRYTSTPQASGQDLPGLGTAPGELPALPGGSRAPMTPAVLALTPFPDNPSHPRPHAVPITPEPASSISLTPDVKRVFPLHRRACSYSIHANTRLVLDRKCVLAEVVNTCMVKCSLLGEWRNGRRAGFRCQYSKGCGGSSPPSPTVKPLLSRGFFFTQTPHFYRTSTRRFPMSATRHGAAGSMRLLYATHHRKIGQPRPCH